MPRTARVVGIGLPHHVTQRGNYGQEIFLDNSDREQYLRWITEYALPQGVSIIGYCLMNNHVHFIVVPEREESMSAMFSHAHVRYSQYFNWKRKLKGHLWQGRFYSCVLDEKHLLSAARYVERNPVRAGLVKEPCDWKWSSAKFHSGLSENNIPGLERLWEYTGMKTKEWMEFIGQQDDKAVIEGIQKSTSTGRPFGGHNFVANLEKKIGKRLHALSIGRPKK